MNECEKKQDEPAFPTTFCQVDACGKIIDTETHKGMSLRDYFAGKALEGVMSLEDNRTYDKTQIKSVEEWRKEMLLKDAEHIFLMADAMLEARNK